MPVLLSGLASIETSTPLASQPVAGPIITTSTSATSVTTSR